MQNLLANGYEFLAEHYKLVGRSFEHLVTRLDALLMVLKSCRGETCRTPWSVLHPDGAVSSLKEALSHEFDAFYKHQPKVGFTSCPMGHIVEEEGPQTVNV